MKKAILILSSTLLVVAMAVSCKNTEKCPAYSEKPVQQPEQAEKV